MNQNVKTINHTRWEN